MIHPYRVSKLPGSTPEQNRRIKHQATARFHPAAKPKLELNQIPAFHRSSSILRPHSMLSRRLIPIFCSFRRRRFVSLLLIWIRSSRRNIFVAAHRDGRSRSYPVTGKTEALRFGLESLPRRDSSVVGYIGYELTATDSRTRYNGLLPRMNTTLLPTGLTIGI